MPFLRARGWVAADEPVRVQELADGVSSLVLLVESDRQRFVVKQALPRLRVQAEWRSAVERNQVERRALETLGPRIGGGRLPQVLYAAPEHFTFAMTAAPAGAVNWKTELLGGRADPATARAAGELLGELHGSTAGDPAVAGLFADRQFFAELRVDPYYRVAAAQHPDLAGAIMEQVERMARPAERRALVHGDFSPKNMLVAGGRLLLLDFEVAHWGDPSFDLAFCLNHLLLKAIHLPQHRQALLGLVQEFWAGYGPAGAPLLPAVVRQLGCLMLARVDGKSPAEYLTEQGRRVARQVARGLLQGDAAGLDGVMRAVQQAGPGPGSA